MTDLLSGLSLHSLQSFSFDEVIVRECPKQSGSTHVDLKVPTARYDTRAVRCEDTGRSQQVRKNEEHPFHSHFPYFLLGLPIVAVLVLGSRY